MESEKGKMEMGVESVEIVAEIQKMKVAVVLNTPDHITGGEGSDKTDVLGVIRRVETLLKHFVFRVCCRSQGNFPRSFCKDLFYS